MSLKEEICRIQRHRKTQKKMGSFIPRQNRTKAHLTDHDDNKNSNFTLVLHSLEIFQ